MDFKNKQAKHSDYHTKKTATVNLNTEAAKKRVTILSCKLILLLACSLTIGHREMILAEWCAQ